MRRGAQESAGRFRFAHPLRDVGASFDCSADPTNVAHRYPELHAFEPVRRRRCIVATPKQSQRDVGVDEVVLVEVSSTVTNGLQDIDGAIDIPFGQVYPATHHTRKAAQQFIAVLVGDALRLNPVFGLPGEQDRLVEEVAAVNPNTIVVLNTSQPVALPWVDKVKAVLEMWWPGDEGGWSTANILAGKTSPAGRLPVTWAKALTDYASTDPKHPERSMKGVDGKTTYTEGVNVGYRWFDKESIAPLFAFGHGLSYTTFEYTGLKVEKASDGGLDVKLNIKNTGNVDSDEVPQVYLGAPEQIPAGVQFPVRALVAFDRIHLKAGEGKAITLHVAPRQLQYWSTKDSSWQNATGKRTVSVGASSRDLRVNEIIN